MAERSRRFQLGVVFCALILLILISYAAVLSFLPQDLSDLSGRTEDVHTHAPSRNIERVLANAAEQGIAVTLTEKELNQWLAHRVKGTQNGLLKSFVSYQGVWIRLDEGCFDLIFERKAFNRPHTISMQVEIEQIEKGANTIDSEIHWKGGQFGLLPIPEGYLYFIRNSYQELAQALQSEVNSLKKLLESRAIVSIKDNQIVLKPKKLEDHSDILDFF